MSSNHNYDGIYKSLVGTVWELFGYSFNKHRGVGEPLPFGYLLRRRYAYLLRRRCANALSVRLRLRSRLRRSQYCGRVSRQPGIWRWKPSCSAVSPLRVYVFFVHDLSRIAVSPKLDAKPEKLPLHLLWVERRSPPLSSSLMPPLHLHISRFFWRFLNRLSFEYHDSAAGA